MMMMTRYNDDDDDAMRLKYGLPVTPAIQSDSKPRCLAKKKDGSICLEPLDSYGRHAEICNVEGTAAHRHDTIRDGLVPAMRPIFTAVKLEQFIYELALFDENTSETTTEARMEIVAETGNYFFFQAMFDIR